MNKDVKMTTPNPPTAGGLEHLPPIEPATLATSPNPERDQLNRAKPGSFSLPEQVTIKDIKAEGKRLADRAEDAGRRK